MKATYYLIMSMRRWDKVELNLPYPLAFKPWFGDGFMRVFLDYDEAVKHADGETVVKVEGIVVPVGEKQAGVGEGGE